jgi:polar amino acid transport system substrate-binding protein
VWAFHRWDRFAEVLADGEVDAIWCGSAITEERRQVFSYSRPYGAIDEAVLVRADSAIHGLADLAGRRVGAIAASTNMALAETFGAAELVAFDGSSDDVFAEMIAAVASGAIDAMVDDEPAFGAQLASGEFRLAHVAATQNPWGAACRLGDRQMVALLDDGLGRAITSGALAGEWRRWFGEKAVPAVIAPG